MFPGVAGGTCHCETSCLGNFIIMYTIGLYLSLLGLFFKLFDTKYLHLYIFSPFFSCIFGVLSIFDSVHTRQHFPIAQIHRLPGCLSPCLSICLLVTSSLDLSRFHHLGSIVEGENFPLPTPVFPPCILIFIMPS